MNKALAGQILLFPSAPTHGLPTGPVVAARSMFGGYGFSQLHLGDSLAQLLTNLNFEWHPVRFA